MKTTGPASATRLSHENKEASLFFSSSNKYLTSPSPTIE
jgi:hypothetical protein